jgi:hypothetical protein
MKKIFALLLVTAAVLPAMAQPTKKDKKAERRQRIAALSRRKKGL